MRPVKARDVYRKQAQVLKALANDSRLMIVDRLAEGECSAGELTRVVGTDQSTVSKHLAVLRSHGIVDDRRDGSSVIYRLLLPCVLKFFSCATRVLKEHGFTVGLTEMVALELPDKPGGLWGILTTLEAAGMNVEYMYAFVQKASENAVIIFRFDNPARAVQVLQEAGMRVLAGEDIYAM